MGMRYQGTITNWKVDQGFGFITPSGGGKKIFVHIKSFASRHRRPVRNEMVTYEVKIDAQGRPQAQSVAFAGEHAPSAASSGRSDVLLIFAIMFLVFVAGVAIAGKLPIVVASLYYAASVIVFWIVVLYLKS